MLSMIFAGLGHIALHYLIAIVLAIGLGIAFYFGPPKVKLYSLVAGVALAIGTFMYSIGVHNGETRVQAQWDLAQKQAAANAAAARASAETQILTEDRGLERPNSVDAGPIHVPVPRFLRRAPPVDKYDRP